MVQIPGYAQSQGGSSMNRGGAPMGPREGNRKRNTFANLLSKYQTTYQNPDGMAALPSLSPGQTANYYEQLGGLAAKMQLTQASLRAQRVGIRAGFRGSRADIRLQKKRGIADVQAGALDRGMTGSSIHAQGEIDVRAQARSEIASAKQQMFQALAQNRIEEQGAGLEFFMGAAGLESQALAQKQEQLAQQLQQNLIISGQETQMDALRAMYEAQMGMFQSTGVAGGGVAARAPMASSGYSPQRGWRQRLGLPGSVRPGP
jgi:hypothetical protein